MSTDQGRHGAPATAWPCAALSSPCSGRPLRARGRSLLVAGDETWPVIDDIAFLRADRIELARAAVGRIEADDLVGATALLLTDQDPYAPDPPPTAEACTALAQAPDSFSFRDAMRRLAFGRVADYFAHRWSDPTYLSGLALLGQLAGTAGRPLLELACGTGHFLRACALGGIEAAGADLVFAKLWLARHYVSPQARLVCFDASADWPLAGRSFRALFCHDAFYFLPDKPRLADRMRRAVGEGGVVALGHAHNAAVDNHSAGEPLAISGYAGLFPGARLFDDRELTLAFVEDRAPHEAEAEALAEVPALSLLWRAPAAIQGAAPAAPRAVPEPPRLGDAPAHARIRLNPLYRRDGGTACIAWPSPRYEQEYAALRTYPMRWEGPDELEADGSAETLSLIRRRIYVDLPPRW